VLWGVDVAGPDDDVECTVPPACRAGSVRGIQVSRRALSEAEVMQRGGVRVTTIERTALDLARTQPLEEAVVALDQYLRARLVTLDRLRAAAAALDGPGCRQVRQAALLADGLAESPQETRLRLLLLRSSLPAPVAQFEVRQDGRFVARVDFAWPDAKVAVEYEGAWHGQPQHVGRDRRRLNELREAGWVVVFVTAADMHDPVRLIARVTACLVSPRYA
jgi:very-short-patch-repair endonuclease